jgi:hypothetical protein
MNEIKIYNKEENTEKDIDNLLFYFSIFRSDDSSSGLNEIINLQF